MSVPVSKVQRHALASAKLECSLIAYSNELVPLPKCSQFQSLSAASATSKSENLEITGGLAGVTYVEEA